MYSYIKGRVELKTADYLVVDNSGIGYKVFTSISTLNKLEAGQQVKVHTYMYVREDVISLFGFITPEELRVFELLITVSGIGPKVANSVLSALSPSKFSLAVITGDVQSLKAVPGIGLKTAQRIILELKDKLKSDEALEGGQSQPPGSDGNVSEAVSALQVLGYSAHEALKALRNIEVDTLNIEEVVRQALKNLSR